MSDTVIQLTKSTAVQNIQTLDSGKNDLKNKKKKAQKKIKKKKKMAAGQTGWANPKKIFFFKFLKKKVQFLGCGDLEK